MAVFLRRRFLQSAAVGLGAAAGLFRPFLRQAWAGPAAPRRFVIVVECNGIYPYSFLSTGARAAINAAAKTPIASGAMVFTSSYPSSAPTTVPNDSLGTALCLGDLAASSGSISLENRAAVVLGLSSTITGGGHTTGYGALSCSRNASTPTGPTIDARLASLVGQQTPFDALRVGISGTMTDRLSYATCAFDVGRPAPIICDPTVVYNLLFGSVAGGTAQTAFNQQHDLLQFASEDATAALAALGPSTPEAYKLQGYLAAIGQLQQRQQTLVAMKMQLQQALPAGFPTASDFTTNADPMGPHALFWLDAQFELVKAALLGGLTNVAVIASGTSTFSIKDVSIDPVRDRHPLQHAVPDNVDNAVANVAAFTRHHVTQITELARALAAVPEGSGTMLDNTLILYMSDNGEQHHSTATEWPMLLVGGNAMGFQTDGRTVMYPGYGAANNRQVSNLFNSLLHAAGDASPDADNFGSQGAMLISPGPLAEIWQAT